MLTHLELTNNSHYITSVKHLGYLRSAIHLITSTLQLVVW